MFLLLNHKSKYNVPSYEYFSLLSLLVLICLTWYMEEPPMTKSLSIECTNGSLEAKSTASSKLRAKCAPSGAFLWITFESGILKPLHKRYSRIRIGKMSWQMIAFSFTYSIFLLMMMLILLVRGLNLAGIESHVFLPIITAFFKSAK